MQCAAPMLGRKFVLCLAHVEENFAIFKHYGTRRFSEKGFKCSGDLFHRLHGLRGGSSWRHSRTLTHFAHVQRSGERRRNLQRKLEVKVRDSQTVTEIKCMS